MAKNLIPIAIIVAAIIIGGVLVYINPYFLKEKEEENILTAKEVGEKAVDYLNQNAFKDQATAVFVNAIEENGMYKLTFTM